VPDIASEPCPFTDYLVPALVASLYARSSWRDRDLPTCLPWCAM
jgi:hypothetical protein